MRKLRIATIGVGPIAHARSSSYIDTIVKLHDHYELCAFCDRSAHRLREAGETYGVKAQYTRLDEMLAQEKPDVVIRLTPKDSTVPLCLTALEAGVHLINEIPIASTLAQADALIEAASRNGVKMEIAENVWVWPEEKLKRQIARAGLLGTVTHGRFHYPCGTYHGLSTIRKILDCDPIRALGIDGEHTIEPSTYLDFTGRERTLCKWEAGVFQFPGESGPINILYEMPSKGRRHVAKWEIEGTDGPLTLACRIQVTGDALSVDFEGTAPSVRQGINVPFCYTQAMVLYSIKCLTVPELPNNGGSVVPISVTAPDGCLLNAQPPSPTGARHMVGHFVSPLLFGALANAVPGQVQADCGMLDLMTFQGRHRDGHDVSTIYFASGGFGALDGRDGAETTPGPSNMAVVPVEVWETLTSTTVERKHLLADSGGAGTYRGGLGQEVVIRNDSGHLMNVFCMANRTDFPPLGLMGGKNGGAREHRINDVPVDPKGHHELAPGDRVTLIQAGGGGFGPPSGRANGAIDADLAEGFVTPEGVARD